MKISREAKIGIACLFAITIFYIGINFLKGISVWDKASLYYIKFDNIKQLAVSAPVYANGYKVGSVHDIQYDYKNSNNKIIVAIDIEDEMRMPKQTTAMIDASLLGSCTVHLVLNGNPAEPLAVGDTINGSEIPTLMSKANEMVPKIESIVTHADTLLKNLNQISSDPNIHLILSNVERLTSSLNTSTEALNRLLQHDTPQLMSTINTTGEHVTLLADKMNSLDVETTVLKLNETLTSIHSTLAKLDSKEGTVGLLLNDTQLYDNLARTVADADSLVTDLKQHPKRYIHFSVFGKKDK